MNRKQLVWELVAAVLVIGGLAMVPVWLLVSERAATAAPTGVRVITLTGVASQGVFTQEDVTGDNYWKARFKPARLVLHVGEEILIRLKSADVHHALSIPDLGIEPAETEAGHVAEIRFTVPDQPGQYLYQCTTRCGDCHEEMLGEVIVLGAGQTEADYPKSIVPARKKCH